MRECPHCHKDIPEDSVFCYHCGKVIDEVSVKEDKGPKLKKNVKIPYYISLVMYIASIVCGALSLYIDKQDKKRGYEPNGNKNYAYISIFLSLFIGLVNLSQVILK